MKQESTRKVGIAIQPEEELLRGRLEIMHTQLNNPKQFKVGSSLLCRLLDFRVRIFRAFIGIIVPFNSFLVVAFIKFEENVFTA